MEKWQNGRMEWPFLACLLSLKNYVLSAMGKYYVSLTSWQKWASLLGWVRVFSPLGHELLAFLMSSLVTRIHPPAIPPQDLVMSQYNMQCQNSCPYIWNSVFYK